MIVGGSWRPDSRARYDLARGGSSTLVTRGRGERERSGAGSPSRCSQERSCSTPLRARRTSRSGWWPERWGGSWTWPSDRRAGTVHGADPAVSSARPSSRWYRGAIAYDGPLWAAAFSFAEREAIRPGDVAAAHMLLTAPERHAAALTPGTTFQVREGERIVAEGVITSGPSMGG